MSINGLKGTTMWIKNRICQIISVTCLLTSSQAFAAHYYMAVFGYEGVGRIPSTTHSFVTFFQSDDTPQRNIIAEHTISWMPRDLAFSIFSPVEPGVNLDHRASMQLAASRGYPVVTFGPYEIKQELYDRSVQQFYKLEAAEQTGSIQYKLIDKNTRLGIWNGQWGAAINCVHAISDMIGYIQTGDLRGVEASQTITQLLWPWVIDPQPQPFFLNRL